MADNAHVSLNTDSNDERYRVIVKLHNSTLNPQNVQILYDNAHRMIVEHAEGTGGTHFNTKVIVIPIIYTFDHLKAHWVNQKEYHAIFPTKKMDWSGPDK